MIYICIPAHNEQQTVGVVLWKLRQVFADFPRDYQLLVGDDASTDKTADVLEPYTRVLPLTVIRSEQQNGYAATLEMLLREAVRRSEYPKRDVVVTLQADFSDEPDDLVPLLKRIEAGADVAAGNKVSKSKPTRMRRLSRSLAFFFVRKLKLPEGLETPFDGYRAYRVYSVRRAIEERAGKRLLRFAGWAVHAELLRSVLPHARRVDVVDVVDRTDRMQRPRREQPFAAAMQVRALSSDREPPGLIGVEELDRIAATASKSRERGTVASMAEYAQRAPATNGGRNRQRTRESRPRDGERQKSRPQTEGSAQRRPRPQAEEGAQRRERKPRTEVEQQQDRRPRSPRTGNEEPRKRQSRRGGGQQQPAAEQLEQAAAPVVEAGVEVPVDETAAPRPKKKRRRRRRGSAGAAGAAAGTQAPSEAGGDTDGADEDATAPEASGEAGAEGAPATGEKKRRRRGGRRGGRGRKRAAPASTEGAGGDGGVATEGVSSNPAPPAEPPARSDNNGELAL
jgi:hypothetical protein